MKKLVLIISLVVWCASALSQSIWTNPITDANPSAFNPFTIGDIVDPNITVSGIGRGSGIGANAGSNRYNANGWDTGTLDANAYFEFTLTPSPGCTIDFTSFVYTGQASGSGPSNFAFRSSLDGFTANIGTPTAGGTTISLAAAAYQGVGSAITFRLYGWGASASTGTWSINDFTFNGTINCGGCGGLDTEPTDEVTDDGPIPACTSGEINWTIGTDAEKVIVVFSTSPITWTPTDATDYNYGDTPTAGVTVIYDGTGGNVGVSGLNQGTTYYYAIYEYNGTVSNCEENFLVGGITGSFTTLTGCTQSYIQSINYNACSAAEGTDEIIFVQIGDSDVNVDEIVIDLPNSIWCNNGCGSNIILNNQAHLDDLNALAGCVPDLFVYCDPIPAGSSLMIFTGNPPSYVVDYSANCTGQQYCAIFLDNADITGNYSNTSTSAKTTTIDFGNGDVSSATYVPADGLCNCDGASANFDENGNLIEYVQNTSCVYPLAINIRSLTGHNENQHNVIEWKTSGDNTAILFEVESSSTGEFWNVIAEINAERAMNFSNSYFVIDENVEGSFTYYRLALYDANGNKTHSNIISVERESISTYYQNGKLTIGFAEMPNHAYTVNIYDLRGSLIYSAPAHNNMTIPWIEKGMFIIEIPEKNTRQKLITQ
ncbi:MAG: hypothetical protein R2780_13655 [Crocinitomicaceae bacterium]|nr:hypothetical protein [Crocinitomicaceae bacterium]